MAIDPVRIDLVTPSPNYLRFIVHTLCPALLWDGGYSQEKNFFLQLECSLSISTH